MENRRSIHHDHGKIDMVTWQFDGIVAGHSVSDFHNLSSFKAANKNDVVRLHFGLRGNYSFYYRQLEKEFDLVGGHHNLMYSPEFDIEVHNKTFDLETFGIQFPREVFLNFCGDSDDLLKQFAGEVISGRSVILSDHWGGIDSSISHVIQQMIHCSFSGNLKKMFLLAKSIELLALSAESCIKAAGKKELFIKSKSDREKIIAVRDLLLNRLTDPPGLSEVARSVGLNEYKLKRGFREVFNNSVFGYLTDQRLNLAYQFLKDTDKTASQISIELGYATPQHFNNAFKRKFGFTPFSVRNNP
jgi:AraC family transcriptional regulator, transcriptional activator of the genes for pyochelin and ferripyochelin receptors